MSSAMSNIVERSTKAPMNSLYNDSILSKFKFPVSYSILVNNFLTEVLLDIF
jgi:hypothetical protein